MASEGSRHVRPRMGWYNSRRVRGGQNFQVDSKAEIKWDYRGNIGMFFNKSKNCLIDLGRVSMSQVWSRLVSVLIQSLILITHNSKAKVI